MGNGTEHLSDQHRSQKRRDAVPSIRCSSSRTARCVFACVLSAIFLLATLGAGAAETKQVLMLHSFGRDFKPWSEYARNIRAELVQQSRWRLEISDHSLMTSRPGDQDSEAASSSICVPSMPTARSTSL